MNIRNSLINLRRKIIPVRSNVAKEKNISIRRVSEPTIPSKIYNSKIPSEGIFYIERKAVGPINMSEKNKRLAEGGPFEFPNMVALNQAIACFIQDAKKIVNIGAGTGTFEWFISVDSSLKLIASEFDKDCLEWCKKNRQRENITYCSLSMAELVKDYQKFDLALAVDVIEHIADFSEFLRDFSKLADRAVLTTPNKDRDFNSSLATTPEYYQHVREWDAGEFYWILKNYYREVELYSMPDQFDPRIKRIGLLSTLTPLIAVCKK